MYFAEILNRCDMQEIEKLKSDILDLPSKIETILDNTSKIEEFAKKVYTQKDKTWSYCFNRKQCNSNWNYDRP